MEEKVEVIDDNFNVLKVVSRKESIAKNLKHRGVLIIIKNSKGQFYVAQRKRTKKVFPLKWGVGAGGAAMPNESFEDAAKRELKEEFGIDDNVEFLFDFSYNTEYNNYKAKVYLSIFDGGIILNEDEFEQGKWVSVEEMTKMFDGGVFCPDTVLFVKKYLEL